MRGDGHGERASGVGTRDGDDETSEWTESKAMMTAAMKHNRWIVVKQTLVVTHVITTWS